MRLLWIYTVNGRTSTSDSICDPAWEDAKLRIRGPIVFTVQIPTAFCASRFPIIAIQVIAERKECLNVEVQLSGRKSC